LKSIESDEANPMQMG
jgi:hypothetical protein